MSRENKKFELESISFNENVTLSMKLVTDYAQRAEETDEKLRLRFITPEDYEYTVRFTDGTVFDKIVLSDGEVLPLSVQNEVFDGDADNGYLSVDSYLLYDECVKAKENGSEEIPVHFNLYGYNLGGYYIIAEDYAVNVPAVKEEVKSLKIISGAPEEIFYGSDYTDISDTVFEITYADDTVKKVKPGKRIREDYYNYYELDGEKLYMYIISDEKKIYFDFCDATEIIPVKVLPSPFINKLEITDYEISEPDVLEWVRYEVTFKDGTVTESKFDLKENPLGVGEGVAGYDVSAFTEYGSEPAENPKDVYLCVRLGDSIDARILALSAEESEK